MGQVDDPQRPPTEHDLGGSISNHRGVGSCTLSSRRDGNRPTDEKRAAIDGEGLHGVRAAAPMPAIRLQLKRSAASIAMILSS